MKTCPQCSNIFDDDYVYCLNDGTVLAGADGEQETVANIRFTGLGGLGERSVECGSCGLDNRATSKFCKRCGAPTAASAAASLGMSPTVAFGFAPAREPGFSSSPQPDPTVDLRRDLFTPPQQYAVAPSRPTSNRNLIIAGMLVGIAVVITFIAISDGKVTPSNTNKSVANVANTAESKLPANFQRNYAGAISGKSLFLSLTREGSSLRGEASTTRTDKLYGQIDDDGNFSVDGYPSEGNLTGRYTGKIYLDGSISGEWSKPDGTYATPFTVQQQ